MFKLGFILIIMVTIGCNRQQSNDTAQDHETKNHEEGTIRATLFSDRNEYFIEYSPLIKDETSNFLVHVTNLETYKPLASGSLTIEIDGEKVRAKAPETEGIFHLPFTPKTPGVFNIRYSLNTENISESLTSDIEIGERHKDGVDDEDSGHDQEGLAPAGEIVFLKENAWKSEFMVKQIHRSDFSSVIQASGQILAVPGEKKHLSARSSGIILFKNKNLVQGAKVEKGQELFVITPGTINGNNFELQYKELKNMLNKSRTEYSRHKQLFEQKVISEKQFIETQTNYTTDSIRFYNLASTASETGLKVSSPISGYIHELNVSEGLYVELGDLLVTISSNKSLLLRADVPLQYYSEIDKIVTATFRTAYSDRIYDVSQLSGKLLAKGSSVAENDHFLPVYFKVENDGTLLEGAYAEFFLKSELKPAAMVVPESALLEEQGSYYLYVQVSGESFTKRAVKPGAEDGFSVEILSGLLPGERIVTKGVLVLKASSMVVQDAGHGHNH